MPIHVVTEKVPNKSTLNSLSGILLATSCAIKECFGNYIMVAFFWLTFNLYGHLLRSTHAHTYIDLHSLSHTCTHTHTHTHTLSVCHEQWIRAKYERMEFTSESDMSKTPYATGTCMSVHIKIVYMYTIMISFPPTLQSLLV